jgi:hypothetical protein
VVPPGFAVEQPDAADLERIAELAARYADLPLGAVDASVVAVAERLGVTRPPERRNVPPRGRGIRQPPPSTVAQSMRSHSTVAGTETDFVRWMVKELAGTSMTTAATPTPLTNV